MQGFPLHGVRPAVTHLANSSIAPAQALRDGVPLLDRLQRLNAYAACTSLDT